MSKKSTKVLSGALAMTTVLGSALGATNAMAATNVDALYKTAYDATMAAEKSKTQEEINVARKAIKELNVALENDKALQQQLVGFLSSKLDKPQHNLFVAFYDILFKEDRVTKKEKLTQEEINRAKEYIIGFNGTPENAAYVPSWSTALDGFQAQNMKEVSAAVEKAKNSKLEEDVVVAKKLVDELATVKNNNLVKEIAQGLEIVVNDLVKEIEVAVVKSVTAVNGKVTVVFDKEVAEIPEGLIVLKDGKALELKSESFKIVEGKVEVAVPEIEQTFEKQSIIYSIKLGEAEAIAAEALVIEAKVIAVESVSVVNSTTLEVTTETVQNEVPSFEVRVGDKVITPKAVEFKKDDTSKKVFTVVLNDVDTLDKKQGEVLVNAKSDKYDNKLPSIASVEAIANNRVMVTFDEEVAILTKANFEVKSVLAGAADIAVESAVVQADKTKVLLTLDKAMTAGKSNYVFNIKADAVKDIYTSAANKNTAYQVIFDGVGTEDTQGATLLSAQYEKATKKVTVVFNREMKAVLDTTKVSINGVALTTQDLVAQSDDKTSFVITLSDDTKAKLDALTGDLTVKVAKDAVEDLNTANLKNIETTSALKVVIAPEFVDADSNYDENTHILTLKFSAPVKVKNIAKIKVAGENALAETTVAGDNKDEILDKDTAAENIRIKLGATNQGFVQGLSKDDKLQVKLEIGAVEDKDGVVNSVFYDKQIKFAIDEVKPVLKTAAYSNADKSLALEFSEPVRKTNINAGNIAFVINGAEPVDSRDLATAVKVDGNKLVLTLGDNDATVLQNAYNDNVSIKIILKANTVQDYAGTGATIGNNANDAMNKQNAVEVGFTNTKIPTVRQNLLSNTQIKLTFTGKMDKALVENIANYSLKDIYGNAVAIKSVVQDSGNQLLAYVTTEKPMALTTGDDFDGKRAYTLTINNLKSVEGIIMPVEELNFEGSEVKADTTAPVINTAKYKTVSGYDNDTIEVAFTEASGLDKASAINPANYVLIDGTTETQLTANNAEIELVGTTVTITLKGINLDAQKSVDKPYKVKVSNVKDVLGNVIVTKDSANVKALVKDVASDVVFNTVGITGLATANPNVADKIVLTFAEELDKATAEKVENYKVVINGDKQPVTAVLDETGKKVTLTLADTDDIIGQNVTVKLQTGLKDAAQNALTVETPVIATVADLVKPAFAAQDAIKAEAKKGQDVITLKFTEVVQRASAEDETNYVVKVNGTVLAAKADGDADYTAVLAGDTVTITLANDKANFVKGDIINVTASGIKDIAGNTMDEATVTATATTAVVATDTAASAEFEAESNRKVVLTFKDELLASTVSKEDFIVEGNVVNDVVVNGKKVTLTLAAAVSPGTDVTIKASETFAIKDEVGNELTVKSLGEKNGIKSDKVAMPAAPALVNNVTFADAKGSGKDGKTVIELGEPSVVGNTFVYKISDNDAAVPTPKVGDDLSGWTAVTNGTEITAVNGKHIGVAEVDAQNKAVQFTDATAETVAYEAATAAVKTADVDLGSSVAFDTATKIVLNGNGVTLTKIKALGSGYDALTKIDTVVTELQNDINATALNGQYTVAKSGNKLTIKSVATGEDAKVDLTSSDKETGATLLGFTTLDAVNGTAEAN